MNYKKIPLLYLKNLNENFFSQKRTSSSLTDSFDIHFAACKIVANYLSIKLNKPIIDVHQGKSTDYLQAIANYNLLRLRRICLKSAWWQYDSGPLIAFFNHHCCALLPKKDGYELIDCKTGKRKKVDKKLAKNIHYHAYILYPALPEKHASIITVLKFTFSFLKKEMRKVVFFQILASLFLTTIPLLTGIIFEQAIPFSNYSLLTQLAILLIVIGIIISLINFLQALLLLRIRFRAQHRIQTAIWDRLLKLPVSFFKKFSVGDLSFRVNVISVIQEELGERVVSTIIAGILSIFYLVLMFFIDIYLASIAMLLVLIMIIFTVILNLRLLKKERQVITKQTKISGILLSLLASISKIRVANKEKNAFQLWEQKYASKTYLHFSAKKLINKITILITGFIGVSTLLIYSLIIWRDNTLSFGNFIIFNAAFVQFFNVLLELSSVISESIEIIPLFQKAKPIFDCIPEQEKGKSKVDLQDGVIAMNDVVFRYPDNDKPLFSGLTIEIIPGSFTAFVGPSGAGKSTIFRLLLGLDYPESGFIKYNGIDLQNINLSSLRSQLGVVMQNTQLIPGTIYENICGNNTTLSREEAYAIANEVGLEDFLRNLPMGIDTLINDGIQMLSGGEVQRICLARALSAKPKLLLLDEATSALDNKIQAKIKLYLHSLKITRLVIAHRLSTIIDADIIYVIDGGKCVESGNYQELMQARGLFYQLIQKQ
ncbi:ATP-binding cassette domain-containing protein [Legionella sp. D16C41]|uniref:ATP-binding cassette domain-containing protein n=1 Tax=Legionella sp. D16C41 TaxID=3402688 RepID=UPI003AF8FDD8